MFTLHMDPKDFGLRHAETVKSVYNTLEDAQLQAAHNLDVGKQIPWYILDDAGQKVVDYRAMGADEKAEITRGFRIAHAENRAERYREGLLKAV